MKRTAPNHATNAQMEQRHSRWAVPNASHAMLAKLGQEMMVPVSRARKDGFAKQLKTRLHACCAHLAFSKTARVKQLACLAFHLNIKT